MIIDPTTAAVNKMYHLQQADRGKMLQVAGTLGSGESIGVEIPTVANPAEDNDAHWTPLTNADGEAYSLAYGGSNGLTVFGAGPVRFTKTATAAAVGLRLGLNL